MSLNVASPYRKEIDGLRTVAIVPVVIYHLKIPFADGYLLPGGFLGVDIFFVISGYLITRIILGEVASTGEFSLRNFYIRRARRILPALLLMILASLVAAVFVLTATELDRFAISVVAALGFVSNFLWYFALSEYGAQPGLLQPLLHTWSLAIEEQFFLLFPLAMMLLAKRRPVFVAAVLGIVLLLCLGLAQVTTQWNQSMSFYSPVSRVWELLAGALLALAAYHHPQKIAPEGWLGWLLPKLSIVVLLFCIVTIDFTVAAHPGLATLPVVLATLALIWFARAGEIVTQALSLPAMVYVGRLSYSIYLWHFPIFAFGRLVQIDSPDAMDITVWIALTMACSIASYHLVERPFRYDLSGRSVARGLAAGLAVAIAFVVTVRTTDLLSQYQAGDLASLYGENNFDNDELRDLSWGPLDKLAEDEEIGPWNAHEPSQNELKTLWFQDQEALKVLVVGNSDAKDLFNALFLNADAFPGVSFARFGMHNSFNSGQQEQLFASPNFAAADIVMIGSRYRNYSIEALPGFIRVLRERGKRVVLVGNTTEFDTPASLPIFDWFVQRYRTAPNPVEINRIGYGSEITETKRRNAELKSLAHEQGVPYLSRRALVCSDEERQCTLATPDRRKTMYDNTNWSLEGAAYYGEQAAKMRWRDILIADDS